MKTSALLGVALFFAGALFLYSCQSSDGKRIAQLQDSIRRLQSGEIPQDNKALQEAFFKTLKWGEPEGGDTVPRRFADIAIKAYEADMATRGLTATRPIGNTIYSPTWKQITTAVKYLGPKMIRWQLGSHRGLDELKYPHFRLVFGIYTKAYLDSMNVTDPAVIAKKLDRVTAFVIAYNLKAEKDDRDDDRTDGEPVYNLGGLDP